METHPDDITTTPDRTDRQATFAQAGRSPVAAASSGLLLLSGLYLVLSPWVVQSMGQIGIAASNVITGLVLMLLGFGYTKSFDRIHPLAWVTPYIGGWVIAAPWVIYHATGPVHTDIEGAPELSAATWAGNLVAGIVAVAAGLTLTVLAVRTGRRRDRVTRRPAGHE